MFGIVNIVFIPISLSEVGRDEDVSSYKGKIIRFRVIENDERAKKIMQGICPKHKIISVDAYSIIRGGGNIHCITQQIPMADLHIGKEGLRNEKG